MRFVGWVWCVVLVLTPTVLAEQERPANNKPSPTVLSGCLRSSAADTAIAGPSGRIYTLEVVDPPPKATATTTTGSNPPFASKTTYSLAAAESVELARHVDHEVQLTGSLQVPSTQSSKRPESSAAAGASQEKPAAGGGHRTLNVTALKMLSTKCP